MTGIKNKFASEHTKHLELLYRVGISLASERDHDRLIEMILVEAMRLCNADGGTIYLTTPENTLRFSMIRNQSLNIAQTGNRERRIDLPDIPLSNKNNDQPNLNNVASASANLRKTINISDAYSDSEYDFSGIHKFDQLNHYRSVSFLAIPLLDSRQSLIGVLQLINALDAETGEPTRFDTGQQRTVEALAAQAGIALDNQMLLQAQKDLLESFIKLIAVAIDSKSPYTGGHCERVPVLTEMLTKSLCDTNSGPFADFNLDNDQWYELKIAAWLHDCGKIITPVHVMDKATKLETIHDRIHEIRARFEILQRDASLKKQQAMLNGTDPQTVKADYEAQKQQLESDLQFIEQSNTGGEFLSTEDQQRIADIGKRPITLNGQETTLLSEEEIENLQISRGTLNDHERLVINGHMVHTIRMLESLPFPPNLQKVPEYAGGHHEKMDGSGYPKGLFAGDMSIPARSMAIADVFEALTAADRPYKPGKTLSESLNIMAQMKKFGHLDPELFDHFVSSGIYLEYASRFLDKNQIDEVDVDALLAIKTEPLELPPDAVRNERWRVFLPDYRDI